MKAIVFLRILVGAAVLILIASWAFADLIIGVAIVMVSPLAFLNFKLANDFANTGLQGLLKCSVMMWVAMLACAFGGLIAYYTVGTIALLLLLIIVAWIWCAIIAHLVSKRIKQHRYDNMDSTDEFVDTYYYDNYARFTSQKQCSKCAAMCSSFSEHCSECGESFPEYADF